MGQNSGSNALKEVHGLKYEVGLITARHGIDRNTALPLTGITTH